MNPQEADIQGLSNKKRISLEKLTDDEKLEKRRERLVGRTVKGVLIRNRQNFAVKWNDCQFDNVYVSERCVSLCLGPRPERGVVAVVKCQIKTIGPTNAPWYLQHPYTDVVELVTRYRRKRRQSYGWMHSGMPKALSRIQFSRDSSTLASRKASLVVSPRGTITNPDEELPKGLQVIASRRGSEVIIEGGKRWEYKPPVRGPMQIPEGWEMRAIRFNGSTYFVPSPPGSRRNTWSKQAARRSRKGSRRRRTGPGPRRKSKAKERSSTQRKPSAADKKKAVQLIKKIEKEERREAERERRKSMSKSAKKAPKARGKSKSPKTEKPKKSRSAKKAPKDDEKEWTCRKCDHSFKLESGLNQHLESKHQIKRRSSSRQASAKKETPRSQSAKKSTKSTAEWQCKKCEHTFKSEVGLNDHLQAKHGITRKSASKSKSSAKTSKSTSERTSAGSARKSSIKNFKCRQCDKSFTSKEGLKSHLTSKHPLIECRKCGSKFKTDTGLKAHLAAKHPSKRSKKNASSKARSKKRTSKLKRTTGGIGKISSIFS